MGKLIKSALVILVTLALVGCTAIVKSDNVSNSSISSSGISVAPSKEKSTVKNSNTYSTENTKNKESATADNTPDNTAIYEKTVLSSNEKYEVDSYSRTGDDIKDNADDTTAESNEFQEETDADGWLNKWY